MLNSLSRRPHGRRVVIVAALSVLGVSAAANAVTFTKADNNFQLTNVNAYVGPPATVPGTADVILFDANVATPVNTTVGVGGNLAIAGVQVTNPVGPITIENGSVAGSPVLSVFTIGTSGIDLSAATQDLTINTATLRLGPGSAATNPFVVGAGRTLTVGSTITVQGGTHTLNASGAGNYVFNGPVTGSGGGLAANFFGTGTTTFNGANSFGGSSGFLALSGGGTYVVNNDAALNGTRLDLSTVTIRSTTGFSSPMGARLLGVTTFDGSSSMTLNGLVFGRNGSRTITSNTTGGAAVNFVNVNISDSSGAGVLRTLTFNGTGLTNVTGVLGDGAAFAAGSGVNKSGTGTLALTGANTYTGTTNLSGGAIVTGNNAALGTSAANVTGTGRLSVGNGTVNTVSGLTGLTMASGTTLETAAVNSAVALASGTFNLADIALDLNNLFNAPGTYTLIDGVAGANAIGTTTFVDADTTNYSYAFNVVGDDGVLTVSTAAVPEPTTLAALGLVGMLTLNRRRKA